MIEQYFQNLTPFQKAYLKGVCRKYWLKWSSALALINGLPVLLSFLFNTDLFENYDFAGAIAEILRISFLITLSFFPIFLILWIYLTYLLFKKIIPLQRDINKGQKLMKFIPAEKYKLAEFNQFFIRTDIKNYPFLKINEWIYDQIPDGVALVFETAPRSAIYLGLRSGFGNEVILTEHPESVY